MSESASVEVPSAEVRVLQVGNGQITLSMYRQLDEATFERFKPFGGVRWWVATPRPVHWFAATHTRPTGIGGRDPLNMRTGSCTPSSRAPIGLPARTGLSWSGPRRPSRQCRQQLTAGLACP